MKKIKYSQKDMAALISEVETQFSNHLAKATAETTDLKKSETVEVEAEQPVVETAPVAEANFDYDEEDIREMNEMYSSMTKAEAKAHFDSLKKALSIEETQETAPIAKSEQGISKVESEENQLLKSEIETLKADKEKLEKSFQDLTAKLVEFVKGSKAPKQKAVTKLEFVAKSEEETVKSNEKPAEDLAKLDKAEISKRLTAQIRSGKLEKSEREKINDFYQNGSKNIESIRHLLTGGK